MARSPHGDGVSASVGWAVAVVVGLLLTLIATAAMANEQSTGQTYPNNFVTNVGFVYDANFPRLAARTDVSQSGSQTTTYGYVPVAPPGGGMSPGALELQNEIQPLASIAYGYDALGRLATRTVSGNGPETFGYDALGRLATHADALGSFRLGYNGDTGQIASRVTSRVSTAWTYLPNASDRRLSGVTTTWRAGGQFTSFAYASNAEDQITTTTQTSDAAIAAPSNASTQTTTYPSPNTLNQVSRLNGGTPWTWDADGNLTSAMLRAYVWAGDNQLISAASQLGGSGPGATSFTYDGLGRRTSITETPTGGTATTTNYVWCGDQLCQARTSAGAVERAYYAEGEYVPGSPATSLYYAPDNLGSVRRVFSTNGASMTSPTYDYDPYGNALQTTAPVTDFTWAGMFHESLNGLYLTNYRPFDPVTGRFQSRDPLGENADPEGNLYPYAANDPVNANDPLGLCPLTDGEVPPNGNADPEAASEGTLSGTRTTIRPSLNAANTRGLMRENESADILVKNGYDVEQNPDVQGTNKNPDYRVNGEIYDNYAPETGSVRNIDSNIEEKIT